MISDFLTLGALTEHPQSRRIEKCEPEMSSLIFTSLSAKCWGWGEVADKGWAHGKHKMEGRKNHVEAGILSVIKFGRLSFLCLGCQKLSGRLIWQTLNMFVEPWVLTACHGASFAALVPLLHRRVFYSVLWTRGQKDATKFKYDKMRLFV